MLLVHRLPVAGSYLLTLVPGCPRAQEVALARSLLHAARRRHRIVWLDCGQVTQFSADALELLLAYDA